MTQDLIYLQQWSHVTENKYYDKIPIENSYAEQKPDNCKFMLMPYKSILTKVMKIDYQLEWKQHNLTLM